MFNSNLKNITFVFVAAWVIIFCGSPKASANNSVVGTWNFATINYDSRTNIQPLPNPRLAWDRGVLVLNADNTLTSTIVDGTGTNYPPKSQGTYTITSDGRLNACVPTDQTRWQLPCSSTNDGTVVSGQLDKTGNVIISSMMINTQQPAMVTVIRYQGPMNSNLSPLLGAWSGQLLRVDTDGSILWDAVTMSFQHITQNNTTQNTVNFTYVESNRNTGSFSGTFTVDPVDGHVNITGHIDNKSEIVTLTAQVNSDMGYVVMKSQSGSVGMGNLIKLQ